MLEIALNYQLVIWLVVAGAFLASKQASLFHPATVYLGFHGLVFVIRPFMVHYFDFNSVWLYIGVEPTEAAMIRTLEVTSLALIIFVGASYFAGRSVVRFPLEPPIPFTPLQRRALMVTTLLFVPLVALSIYATRNGVEGNRVNGVYVMTNSTGYLNDAQFVIAPLFCVWAFVTRFHWINSIFALAYIGYRSWFGWSRWTIVLFFLTLIMAYCWDRRKKWVPSIAVLLAIPILVLFNVLGHNRDYFKTLILGPQPNEQAAVEIEPQAGMSEEDKFRAQADTQDFANFDYLTFVLAIVPERTETYTYGKQYLQLFTEPIPRILWKGKPVGAPVRTFDIQQFGNFTGLTFSLPGDGWINGGWAGLIITMGLAGGLVGRFHRWFWRHVNNPMVAVFYVTALAMAVQWFRDGGMGIVKFMFWIWLPLLVWLGMIWLMGPRLFPQGSIILRPGQRVRILQWPGDDGRPPSDPFSAGSKTR